MPTSNSNLPSSRRRLRLHVWTQNYAPAAGGIVTFSRFLVRALRDLYPEAEICVFSKNDSGTVGATPHLDPLLERGGEETAAASSTPHLDPLLGRRGEETERSTEIDREVAVDGTRVACAPRIVGFGEWPAVVRAAAFAIGAIRGANRVNGGKR
jgi:hypothetical protein